MLIYRGQILLERRPQRGLWGGLLTPPQFDAHAALTAQLSTLGLKQTNLIALPERSHRFTHFTLRFTPYVVRITRAPKASQVKAGKHIRFAHRVTHLFEHGQWCAWTHCTQEALPTPVRQLVHDLQMNPHGGTVNQSPRVALSTG